MIFLRINTESIDFTICKFYMVNHPHSSSSLSASQMKTLFHLSSNFSLTWLLCFQLTHWHDPYTEFATHLTTLYYQQQRNSSCLLKLKLHKCSKYVPQNHRAEAGRHLWRWPIHQAGLCAATCPGPRPASLQTSQTWETPQPLWAVLSHPTVTKHFLSCV